MGSRSPTAVTARVFREQQDEHHSPEEVREADAGERGDAREEVLPRVLLDGGDDTHRNRDGDGDG